MSKHQTLNHIKLYIHCYWQKKHPHNGNAEKEWTLANTHKQKRRHNRNSEKE